MVASGSRTMIAGSSSSCIAGSHQSCRFSQSSSRDARALARGGLSLLLASELLPLGGRPQIDAELRDAAFSICEYNARADDDCQEVYA